MTSIVRLLSVIALMPVMQHALFSFSLFLLFILGRWKAFYSLMLYTRRPRHTNKDTQGWREAIRYDPFLLFGIQVYRLSVFFFSFWRPDSWPIDRFASASCPFLSITFYTLGILEPLADSISNRQTRKTWKREKKHFEKAISMIRLDWKWFTAIQLNGGRAVRWGKKGKTQQSFLEKEEKGKSLVFSWRQDARSSGGWWTSTAQQPGSRNTRSQKHGLVQQLDL